RGALRRVLRAPPRRHDLPRRGREPCALPEVAVQGMTTVALDRPRPSGLIGWLASTDHKRIGLMQMGWSLVFFLASGIVALLMRSELAEPGMQIVSRQSYNELFTIHGSGMIYLTVTPLALAVGIYLVPLQLGAA